MTNIIKKPIFFKYSETSKWYCTPKKLFKTEDKTNFKFEFKMTDHWCSKFILHDNKLNNFKYTYLTFNTNEKEILTSEKIGKVFHKNKWKDQLVNYNYQIITTENTDNLFVKTTKCKEIEKANELHELLLISDKIPTIEERLSKGFELFNQCYKYTQKFNECYQSLAIIYGEDAKVIFKLVFHNYIQ